MAFSRLLGLIGEPLRALNALFMLIVEAAVALSEDEVQKIALLARLELQPQEVAEMAGQLGKIVDFVAQLDALNTDGVEPLVHAIELENVLVDDQVRTGLDRQAALSNSPAHDDECFRVPAVL